MPMTSQEFGVAASGAAAMLTLAWTVSRETRGASRSRRRRDAQTETDRLALALDGFDKLVDDMRTEIDRGRAERADLVAKIAHLEQSLEERDSQIADLRDQVRILTEKAQGSV